MEFAGQIIDVEQESGGSLTALAAALFHSPLFTVIKTLAAIYVAVIIVDLVLLMILSGINENYRKNKRGANLPTYGVARAKWRKIMARLKKDDQNYYKAAILEADQMVEKVLADVGYGQSGMAAKVERMRTQHLSGVDALAKAHAMSIRVIQEPDLMLTRDDAAATLALYKTFLDDMEIFG